MQTKIESACEAVLNVGSGMILSMIVWQLIANPLFGYTITLFENFALTSIFTSVSLLRSYFWRRLFNRRNT